MSPHDQTPDMSLDTAMSIREAAVRVGVTEKTVRRWIKSGRLHALKIGGQYRITSADLGQAMDMPGVSNVHPSSTHNMDTGHDSPRVDMSEGLDTGQGEGRQAAETIDLAPLTDLIDDLTRRNTDLAAAAAMWQTRAAHLENKLLQLTAGSVDPTTNAPRSPESDGGTSTGVMGWVRRLWRP